jgi:hypothetical protein
LAFFTLGKRGARSPAVFGKNLPQDCSENNSGLSAKMIDAKHAVVMMGQFGQMVLQPVGKQRLNRLSCAFVSSRRRSTSTEL